MLTQKGYLLIGQMPEQVAVILMALQKLLCQWPLHTVRSSA
jgi:hypothetical protein